MGVMHAFFVLVFFNVLRTRCSADDGIWNGFDEPSGMFSDFSHVC